MKHENSEQRLARAILLFFVIMAVLGSITGCKKCEDCEVFTRTTYTSETTGQPLKDSVVTHTAYEFCGTGKEIRNQEEDMISWSYSGDTMVKVYVKTECR